MLRVGDGARTRDLHLGKVTRYQLRYAHEASACRDGSEAARRASAVLPEVPCPHPRRWVLLAAGRLLASAEIPSSYVHRRGAPYLEPPWPRNHTEVPLESLADRGDTGSRTPDILLAKQTLYQLSYVPVPDLDRGFICQTSCVLAGGFPADRWTVGGPDCPWSKCARRDSNPRSPDP